MFGPLTAAALKGEAERCLAAGMDAYLAKPVSIPKLLACIGRLYPFDKGQDLLLRVLASDTPPAPGVGPQWLTSIGIDLAAIERCSGGKYGQNHLQPL